MKKTSQIYTYFVYDIVFVLSTIFDPTCAYTNNDQNDKMIMLKVILVTISR